MPVSVVIPVGPYEANQQWLGECLNSLREQTTKPDEIVIIDDGAGLKWDDIWGQVKHTLRIPGCLQVNAMPWRTGISHAFNYGIALARNECVVMLGSDDTLDRFAVQRALECYDEHGRRDAYYYFGLRYMDTGELQTVPCNAAMVTKGFWKLSGGFPIESAIGRGDQMLLSICLKHRLPVYPIANGEPLYNYRRHDDAWTGYAGSYHHELMSIMDKLTANWKEPEWANRYL